MLEHFVQVVHTLEEMLDEGPEGVRDGYVERWVILF